MKNIRICVNILYKVNVYHKFVQSTFSNTFLRFGVASFHHCFVLGVRHYANKFLIILKPVQTIMEHDCLSCLLVWANQMFRKKYSSLKPKICLCLHAQSGEQCFSIWDARKLGNMESKLQCLRANFNFVYTSMF